MRQSSEPMYWKVWAMSEQGSKEWRKGPAKWTASKFADLIATDKRTGKPLLTVQMQYGIRLSRG